jgi:hypothetical protein
MNKKVTPATSDEVLPGSDNKLPEQNEKLPAAVLKACKHYKVDAGKLMAWTVRDSGVVVFINENGQKFTYSG